ncbi:MAG: hypothetical protein Q9169_008508 [Polycauliona sp. 2 TL-2023]
MLGAIPAELKLVIAGNHDLELDKAYWDSMTAGAVVEEDTHSAQLDPDDQATAMDIMTGIQAKQAGVTYLTEGTHTFTLSTGATFKIYVSPYTPEYGDWAFLCAHSEDRFNSPGKGLDGSKNIAINPIPTDVDIVMTHGASQGILDFAGSNNVGCPHLLQAVKRVRPMIHCFGHIHEGNGVEVVDWTAKEKEERNAREQVGRVERKNDAVHRAFEVEWVENPYPETYDWRMGKGDRKGETTLAVNASIMDSRQMPSNAPWLVVCDLKKAA